MTYLDPMALTAYHMAVMQADVDQEKDQARARLDGRAGERTRRAAKPNSGPIAVAGFSRQIQAPSASVGAEVV
jgi:hypothetical protein